MKKIKVGLMGFGEIARHFYKQCLKDDLIDVVAISDIAQPDILCYLLLSETKNEIDVHLEGNYLISGNRKARIFQGSHPTQIPWDAFDVDFVLDSTRKFLYRKNMEAHLRSGAKRVILSTLPKDDIDRIAIMGVNDDSIRRTDKLISPGSSTTNAAALMIKTLDEAFGVEYAITTTIHSYTADQPLRNLAGENFRRSRSAVTNIIPNTSPTPDGVSKVMPEFRNKIIGSALNVPVHAGSLLDLTTIIEKDGLTMNDVHAAIEKKAKETPKIVSVAYDPIVSSDIFEDYHSAVYDRNATILLDNRMLKTITWYHTTLAMAVRIKEIIIKYVNLDKKGGLS
ncbi:MAG: hypothetical protein J7J86_03905 [Bacteroidales bacterium]|nr:hypothetical protein [Bacteroidales bacterium]